MPDFICRCEKGEVKASRATCIKITEDGETSYGVECSCGKPMELDAKSRRSGVPGFSSNRWGQVR